MSRHFEIEGNDWGDVNTIRYWLEGYTQVAKNIFKDKSELMQIFEGIADDYFESTPPKSGEPSGALSKKELEEMEDK